MEGAVDVSQILGAGCYLLLFYEEIVYVGKARNLLKRIYAHRNLWERSRERRFALRGMKPIRFTGVMVIPCKEYDLDRMEQELIRRYRPKYNEKHKPLPARLTTITVRGIDIEIGTKAAKEFAMEDRRF